MSLRLVVKKAVERGLVASGIPARRIRDRASGTVILSYHNVVPEGARSVGDRSLHLPRSRFAAQLERLVDTHDVVALETLVPGEAPEGRPRAVITFDDAYVGALTAGFDELSRRGLPATVFVPPGLLGADGFWWDRLALDAKGLSARVRAHALETLGGRGDAVLAWAQTEGIPIGEMPDHARPVDAQALADAMARGPFSVGSHTWSHVNLATVPLEEARREMERGHRWLTEQAPTPAAVDWLAYPYGRTTPDVEAAAAAVAGRAVRVEGGAAEVGGRWVAAAHALPRINVPAGLSPDGLTLRLAAMR